MSIAQMTLAWQTDLPHADKFVLLALADNANDEGWCFPSIPNVARRCSLDERTVQRVLARLEGVHVTRHPRPGRSTMYRVHPRQGVTTSPGTVSPPAESHPGADSGDPRRRVTTTPGTAPGTPGTVPPITITESSGEPSPNRQGARAARATRLPEGFELTEERRKVALDEHVDPERTFAKFCDHWRAASGAKARKVDWDATWRNWCRTEADRGGNGARPRSSTTPAKGWRERAAVDPRKRSDETPEQFLERLEREGAGVQQ